MIQVFHGKFSQSCSKLRLTTCLLLVLCQSMTCQSNCRTVKSISGYSLTNHSYQLLSRVRLTTCVITCQDDPECHSLNFKFSLQQCELNNETRLSIEPNYFVPSGNTVYLDNLYRSYNPCDRKPCKNNGFCITMNSYPGYECNCKDGYFGPNCETHRCYVNRPLGMSNGEITDDQISASSYASGYPPYKARLGGNSCWRSASNTLGEFLEINFGRKRHVRQLKIEKDPQEENWTENFYLEYYSGSVWSNLSRPYHGVKVSGFDSGSQG